MGRTVAEQYLTRLKGRQKSTPKQERRDKTPPSASHLGEGGSIGLRRAPARDFGRYVFNRDGSIKGFVEKPKEPISDWALIGVYVFNDRVFDAIKKIKPSWRGELEITDTIQAILDDSARVEVQRVQGWWKDTGRPEDLLEANQLVLQDLEAKIEGTIEESATINGKVSIGSGTTIQIFLTTRARVEAQRVQDWWKDTGRPEDLLEANQLVLQDLERKIEGTIEESVIVSGKVSIGRGTITHSRTSVRGHAIIGEGCEIGPNTQHRPLHKHRRQDHNARADSRVIFKVICMCELITFANNKGDSIIPRFRVQEGRFISLSHLTPLIP